MICRFWRGWTTRENADAYETLLRMEIFPGIARRALPGYRGIHLLRRDVEDEIEFATVMWFDDRESVRDDSGQADGHHIGFLPYSRARGKCPTNWCA